MKLIRISLAAAVLCVAALPLLGSSSAIASEGTVICKETKDPCLPKNRYLAPTVLQGKLKEGTTATFKSTSGTVTCKESSLEVGTTIEGETLLGEVTSLAFSKCEQEKKECAVATVSLPYLAEIKAVEAGSGTLAMKKKTGVPGATVTCGGGVKCTFTGEATLDYVGGNPATIKADEEVLKSTDFLCPEVAKLTGSYSTTALGGANAPVKGDTTFCSKEEEDCEAGSTYQENTEVEANSTSSIFVPPSKGEVTCTESQMNFETIEKKGQPLDMSFSAPTFGGCGPNCSTVTASVGSKTGFLRATGNGDGNLRIDSLTVTFNCPLECVYSALVTLDFEGGKPATVVATKELLTKTTGLLCEPTVNWSASYSVKKPSPLYVSG